MVRINDTVDLGLICLTAARRSGSGIGIGLQAKGTALIHPARPVPSSTASPFTEFQCFSVIRPLLDGSPRLTRAGRGAG
ncbi:glycerol dehydratase reactivase beta/small subunit family protein [Acrocarpospora pleiomorpha]|uniref:glycerol dehydratase reactivase beta/small subunit family protein n=1 Tax=Acrocarpospora pleiomorpha TaxID=90975 RepID=UPI0012D2E981